MNNWLPVEELCERHLMVLVRLQDRIQGPGLGLCGACKTLHQWAGSVPADWLVGSVRLNRDSPQKERPSFSLWRKILSEVTVLMNVEESRRSRPLAAFLCLTVSHVESDSDCMRRRPTHTNRAVCALYWLTRCAFSQQQSWLNRKKTETRVFVFMLRPLSCSSALRDISMHPRSASHLAEL